MKKIFAMVISLLFVVSVFGVAQMMATAVPTPCGTEYYKISSDTVKVGETFTISLYTDMDLYGALDPLLKVKIEGKTVDEITLGIIEKGGLPFRIGNVELINVEYFNDDGTLIYSGLVLGGPGSCGLGFPCWSELKAEDPALDWDQVRWVTWTFRGVSPGTLTAENAFCDDTVKVTVLSKDLPFKFFAKLFGFGKKD